MAEEEINIDDPASPDVLEELRKIVNEQKEVIVAQNEAIKKLEGRVNDIDRKTTASGSAKKEEVKPTVPEPDPQEVAYRAMLREMGIEDNKME